MKNGYCLLIVLFILAACSPNNVTIDDSLGKHFKMANVRGSFAVLDNGTGEFTIYNLERYRDSAYLPASTFEIVSSLIGLQTGKIVNDSMVIQWDGIDRNDDECDKDMSMYSAFRHSCPAWYQEMARRIGADTIQQYLDTLSYGNKKISRVDSFWLDNALKIKPDEQLGLVKKLYFNELPFHKLNQEIVKRAMLIEDNTAYKLAYKTGWGYKENGDILGWTVGWIEENKHPFFFVLNIDTPDKGTDISAIKTKLLQDILTQLEFMRGKK